MRSSLALAVATLAATACTKKNPEYCEAASECESGFTCDLDLHRCVADPDAAVDLIDAASSTDAPPPPDAGPPPMSFALQFADSIASIQVAPDGDIVVAGSFSGTTDFGDGDVTAGTFGSFFLAKYDGITGAHVWSKTFVPGQLSRLEDMAVGPDGSIAMTGSFHDSVSFGGPTLMMPGSPPCCTTDGFVVRFTSDGSHVWSRHIAGDGDEYFYAVAVDIDGNVVVGGGFFDQADFGKGIVTSSGGADIFVAKYRSSDGAHLWSHTFDSTDSDSGEWATGIAVDSAGNVVVAGNFWGAIDFGGGGTFTPTGGWDIFLAKYRGSDGDHLMSKAYGNGSLPEVTDLSIGASDSIHLTGKFRNSLDLGGDVLEPAGAQSAYVATFTNLGGHTWSTAVTSSASVDTTSLATNAAGNVLLSGGFSGTADFGSGERTADGTDAFVLELSAGNGDLVTLEHFGAAGTDRAFGAAEHEGATVLGGQFEQTVDFGVDVLSAAGADVFVVQIAD